MATNNLGTVFQKAREHHRAGRLKKARELYRRVLERQPKNAVTLHWLGVLNYQRGEYERAAQLLQRAIALQPSAPMYHYHLGNAWNLLKRYGRAVASFQRALALRPQMAVAHYNLGIVLGKMGKMEDSVGAYQRAVQVRDNFPDAWSNLGNVLRDLGRLQESEAACRKAIALRPDFAFAQNNLGAALDKQGRAEEAIACYEQAIVGKPDYALAHWNLALVKLLLGDWERGWEEFEWRWRWNGFPSPKRDFPQPLWDGSELAGRKILLHAEQGLGDVFQCMRYVPMVAERGGNVTLEVQTEIKNLLASAKGVTTLVARGDPLGEFAVHCPLMSLPRIFKTRVDSAPAAVPYLWADPEKSEAWRPRVAGGKLKVGLVWAGRPEHANDRNRSCPLATFAPLAGVPNVVFYSLQKGAAGVQAKTPPAGMDLVDWTEELQDFSDTAALMAQMDLIIAVDTSVIHLAGAMGKVVWTLVPFHPDWRWLREREETPWYPTMRLFRQTTLEDWASVLARVGKELKALTGKQTP